MEKSQIFSPPFLELKNFTDFMLTNCILEELSLQFKSRERERERERKGGGGTVSYEFKFFAKIEIFL